jgi:5-methyltetrahydrofolate--homocysteine methyltransferase
MHSVFLYHAIREGLDMAIVNPGMLQVYDDIEPTLLKAVEDVILNTDDEATERLISLASVILADSASAPAGSANGEADSWRSKTIEERLTYALSKGDNSHLADDIPEALQKYGRPIDVIEQPLMQAMEHIGQLFGEGKMFLPQVVKTARTMKQAVAILQPYIEQQRGDSKVEKAGKILLATVKGDVHDIGKNIVSVIMTCNNYEVIDMGVMVPAEQIVRKAIEEKVDMIGLSGLITPSLEEMVEVAYEMQRAGLDIPIMIGGATTSELHVALKIAPVYGGPVVWMKDASQNPLVAARLMDDEQQVERELDEKYEQLRHDYQQQQQELLSLEEARNNKPNLWK